MASASPGVKQWRTIFLTLRDETLMNPPAPILLSLLCRLVLSPPPDPLLSAAQLLPAREVTSDVILLAELVQSVSKCEDCDDALYNISHLIHEIICKVQLEINPTCWNTLLNFLEAIFGRLEINSSIKSNKIGTIKDSLDILSFLQRVYERNASLSENTHLIRVTIRIISNLHNELIKSNQSINLWDLQNSAFSVLGKVLNRAGSNISKDLWQSIIEVLRKVMDFLAANNLILENNIMSRFYTSFLQCLHLVLSDPKGLLSGHMAGFVSTLQLFFTYGLNSAPQNSISNSNSNSKSKEIQFSNLGANLGANCKSNRSNNAYKPPHLRRKEGLKINNNYNYNSDNYSDSDSNSRYEYSSSDSDLSDNDYSKINSDRFRSSKVRQNAICCIQDICRAEAKSLTSFWPLILPENDVLQLRKNQATLMTCLMFDPIPKVRIEAVQTISTMLESQTLVLSQVAEFKESSKPNSFTTLSSSLGKILMQLHTGVLYLVERETHNSLVNGLFKHLIILISATPYGRMPGELLPNAISSLCNRVSQNKAIKNDQYSFVVNVLSCLEVAFSKSPPSLDVLKLLQNEISQEFKQAEGKSSVFNVLFNCLQKDAHLSIKCGSLQVLRAILHNYPTTANATWRKVSNAVNELLKIKYFEDLHFGPSKVDNDKNAPPTLERCITSVIKVMDECLRAGSGFQGFDDNPDSNSRFSDLTRNKRVSSAPCFDLNNNNNNYNNNNNNNKDYDNSNNLGESFGFVMWNEAIEDYLPLALSHSSPMVRAVSVTCFAGMTLNVFNSLSEQKKEFVVSSSIFAATKDSAPSVRSAACRAVGIISSFSQIISNSRVLSDFIHAVELNTRNPLASVRITASWALANICDSLRLKSDELPEPGEWSEFTSLLVETALRLTKDGDKIKSNAVRALGYLSRFIRFDNSNGDSNWLERMVQAFLSCVTTGNVKVQWNVCHALSNLFLNTTLKLQSMPWAPTVYRILMLLIRDSTNYKIRIHATIALAVPSSKIDYGSSYSDVVQGIIHVLELLSNNDNSNSSNSAPSSFKYKENLEKQLAFSALHLLGFVSSDDEQSLKDFLIKKANFLEEWLKPLCVSLKEDLNLNLNHASSSDNSNSEERENETQSYLSKSLLLKSIKALINLYQNSRHQIVANKFEKLVKSVL